MNTQELVGTASAMVADGKGLLAIDESNSTGNNHDTGDTRSIEQRDFERWENEGGEIQLPTQNAKVST